MFTFVFGWGMFRSINQTVLRFEVVKREAADAHNVQTNDVGSRALTEGLGLVQISFLLSILIVMRSIPTSSRTHSLVWSAPGQHDGRINI